MTDTAPIAPVAGVSPKPTPWRWVAVVLLILYGFAKLNGSQFTILDSELSKPMGEVSGFWLTWYYFGYSAVYGTFLALAQIGGALLLAWPRTALAGALVLVPVVGNIILIDLFYGVDADAMLVAVLIFACLLLVILPHVHRLLAAVLLDPGSRPQTMAVPLVLVALLAGAGGFTWWIANYNNRAPTAIDGTWSVVSDAGASPWQQVFFEYNRAHMAVFRDRDGRDRTHHFELDEGGVVRVWETWLRKGELIMEGRVRSDTEIELRPVENPETAVILTRTARPGGRLVRGAGS
jgi:hypothetical protein